MCGGGGLGKNRDKEIGGLPLGEPVKSKGVPTTVGVSPVGISPSSTGVYRLAHSRRACDDNTLPLAWPPKFQYACCARFTIVGASHVARSWVTSDGRGGVPGAGEREQRR